MSGDDDLLALGVSVRSVSHVEAEVAAAADAAAASAEAEDYAARCRAIAADVAELHKQVAGERKKPSPDGAVLRSLQRRIDAAEARRRALAEAHKARCEIASKNVIVPVQAEPLRDTEVKADRGSADPVDAQRKLPNESQREFDIRVGKITPFQNESAGQPTFLRRRKLELTLDRSKPVAKRPRLVASDSDDEDESTEESPVEDDDANDPDFEGKSGEASDDGDDVCTESAEQSAVNPDDDEEVVVHDNISLPASLFDRLFDYQKTGLKWLLELHNQQCGGVLADEMGLGKTVQVVSFLAALEYSAQLPGPVIIVAPATVLKQWAREFQAWWPRFHVRILHHSSNALEANVKRSPGSFSPKGVIRDVVENDRTGVLVTSYEQLRKHHLMLLDKFEYVILDEGHKIRNPDAEITLICKRFHTPRRILLTGTPMQNNLKELWSLFDFVFPGRLGTLVVFEEQFSAPIAVGGYANASRSQVYAAYRCALTLKDLVAPYLLRRMKKDVALKLPEKEEQVLFCRLSSEQREAYKAFLDSRTVKQVLNGKANLLYAITMLRKICNHVDIATSSPLWEGPRFCRAVKASYGKDNEWDGSDSEDDAEEMWANHPDFGAPERSGKLKVLETVLASWHKSGSRALVFTQTRIMLDILTSFADKRRYTYRRMDGQTPVARRMQLIDEFNSDSSIFLFVLSTRVGGLGTNLTGADRVVLVDPDWNPSTDLQARERAWRIGQTRPVVVYRLVTSGTIEEKILQRQVYKSLLSSKVLSDPRQRRFFKRKEMKDLFVLAPDHVAGTETGDLFAGTRAREIRKQDAPLQADDDMEGDPSRSKTQKMLTDLFNDEDAKQVLQSAMNHDDMMSAGSTDIDTELFEHEADRLVAKAVEEVQRSSRERQRENVAIPTWTGRSGLAGIPVARPALGLPSGRSSLLKEIREREGLNGCGASKPSSASERLVRDIVEFLKQKGGCAVSDAVVNYFGSRVGKGEANLAVFKAALKRVAVRQKGIGPNGEVMWVLRGTYRH